MHTDGERFGKYVKEEIPLGEGGFGTVYKAIDTVLKRPVALKVLDPLLMRDQKWVGRFRQEAQVMARLKHPHIVPVYDTGTENGRLFIAMELIEGGDLADYLELHGSLSWSETMTIASQVAQALDYAHRQNVVHHDLKPGNIMLSTDGPNEPFTVLTDFGLSLLASENTMSVSLKSRSGGMMGSPAYMAPEIWRGEKVTGAVDQYALACLVYEMLTGRKLFDQSGVHAIVGAHLAGPEFIGNWPTDAPQGIEHVLLKALAQNADGRYRSCEEFVFALKDLINSRSNPLYDNRNGDFPVERRPYLFGSLIGVAVLILMIVVGVIWAYWALIMPNGDDLADINDVVTLTPDIVTMTIAPTETPIPIVSPTSIPLSTETPIPVASPTSTATPVLLASPTPEPEAGDVRQASLPTGQDVMMVFVPEGEFTMGSESDEAADDEGPVHEVFVADFWLDQTEVTNEQFAAFVGETGYVTTAEEQGMSRGFDGNTWEDVSGASWQNPQGPVSNLDGLDNHPVIHVSWVDAKAFCSWRDARLPTEAEWEKAARGVDGRIYPWGNQFSGDNLNYCDANCPFSWKDENSDDGYELTAPVGSYSPRGDSPYGAQDMAGNVWEWTSSLYLDYPYVDDDVRNPDHPNDGDVLVLRGGSWDFNNRNVRAPIRSRGIPTVRLNNVGFRCASHLP